uniref:UDP-N-acetylglucosamine 2-epimerase n=2 Tax=Candidatus Bipolaricaulota TaxID=67810 RepID=H5SG83_9BACT|nr:UDP-N-acetylglucosamine 2-epimerase [uncultured Acetothermia bacterium]BAL60210.1 UDP-N-acetylglucosamine-2-epimerase [Candidatus Acetothermum autotrophicum]
MKLLDIVGARPQFIKVGPILRAIEKHNREHPQCSIQEILVHTGQHYDYMMSRVFFDELGLKAPDYHLGVGSGTHAYQTGEMLKRIEDVLLKEKPDLVMVYGDTNSTLAGALAAAKLHIPVAHVEAGLRSFNKKMPEEINRVLTDHVSNLLFCPTETAVKNLAREGITQGVHLVGDVMYDSVIYNAQLAEKRSQILEQLHLQPKSYALATIHRAENTDDPQRLRSIFQALEAIAADGLPVIVPLHPRTRKQLESVRLSPKNLQLIEPVSYLEMLLLEKYAKIILTDSGGVQKEAFFFQVPCVTLREETEWVETVEAGWNVLAGWQYERIVHAVRTARSPSESAAPYGDGHAAEKIVKSIRTR